MSSSPYPAHFSIIDEEHRGIQRAIVELMEAIILGANAAKVLQAAENALKVTRHHFGHEEAMLRTVNFPKLKKHADDHAKIARTLELAAEELKNRESVAALRSLREFRRLLLVHLQTEDEDYRDVVNQYAAEQGISPLRKRIRHAIPEK